MPNILLVFIFYILSNLLAVAALEFTATCMNNENYTTGSVYGFNLQELMSSMATNIDSSSGFYNASAGQDPNTVYSTVLCRGDIEFDACRMLAQKATTTLLELCPNRMKAILRHDNCTLRYSNEEIVGKLDTVFPTLRERKPALSSPRDPDRFNVVLTSLLDDLRIKAANSTSPKKIAAASRADPAIPTIYALVQCTPDLHPDDCNTCLTGATTQLRGCNGMIGCTIFRPNCVLRHENNLFFNESKIESLAVPASVPSPAPMSVNAPVPEPQRVPVLVPDVAQSPKGNHAVNNTRVILPVVVSIVACLMILVFISILLWRRRRRNDKRIGHPETEKINLSKSLQAPSTSIGKLDTSAEEINTIESLQNPTKPTEQQLETIDENNSVALLQNSSRSIGQLEKINTIECLQYEFGTLKAATNGFSETNKLGQGAFGTVYKGVLDGNEIAVKKLSENSTQGKKEFETEILCLSQLRHRNLVSLRGFSIEGTEKLLVYEFFPNGSLNRHIFDAKKPLDWGGRHKIILGIAKGLVYLNEESPQRIIHRDLKASNVLLDEGMNAKISDFGLAKLFGPNSTHKSTMNNNAGTSGYMPPEYTMQGRISDKFDVYSFGVVLLEIVSGRKWNCMTSGQTPMDLISYTLKNWRDGTKANIVDTFLRSSSSSVTMNEILKCIRLGLLCVEENTKVRPTMSDIVSLLRNLNNVTSEDPPESTYNRWLDPPKSQSIKGSECIPPQSDETVPK